jgi:hypothetical protein
MNKREIHLADGRYVILYTFDAPEDPKPEPPAPVEEPPEPPAPIEEPPNPPAPVQEPPAPEPPERRRE